MSKPSKKETLGSLVGRTAKVMGRHLLEQFRLAGHEMNREHFLIMVHLWEEDGLTHLALGDRCGADKTATTRAIDTLEKKNYVVRVPDQLDRRQKRVFLTHEGKQIQEEMMALGQESLKHVTKGLDEEELKICQKVLRQIQNNLKEYM
ncbi:MAG: MarR family winged helix-turn-helix transcriptional regulator [Bacteroidia bacterium]